MNPEREHLLREAFPTLYGGLYGFACGDGWYTLLSDLGRALDGIPVKAVQVKEKFGTLRCYTSTESSVPEETHAFIDAAVYEAEQASGVTCEDCGAPGERVGGGWIRTLCPVCAKQQRDAR